MPDKCASLARLLSSFLWSSYSRLRLSAFLHPALAKTRGAGKGGGGGMGVGWEGCRDGHEGRMGREGGGACVGVGWI